MLKGTVPPGERQALALRNTPLGRQQPATACACAASTDQRGSRLAAHTSWPQHAPLCRGQRRRHPEGSSWRCASPPSPGTWAEGGEATAARKLWLGGKGPKHVSGFSRMAGANATACSRNPGRGVARQAFDLGSVRLRQPVGTQQMHGKGTAPVALISATNQPLPRHTGFRRACCATRRPCCATLWSHRGAM